VVVQVSSCAEQSSLVLKDIPSMSAAAYYRLTSGIFSTISELVEKVEASYTASHGDDAYIILCIQPYQ